MPNMSKTSGISLLGGAYPQTITVTGNQAILTKPTAGIAPAKPGVLTVRTDADTGSLTMETGHGITTAAKLDVFWSIAGVNYSRRNMTVGTVASLVVPIDGGTGDNLPAAATAISAMIPTEETLEVAGDDVQGFVVYSPVPGWIVFTEADGTLIAAYEIDETTGGSRDWMAGNGITNPLAGVSVGKVKFSHGNISNTVYMEEITLRN